MKPWRRWVILAGKIIVALAIGYFLVATAVHQWSAVRDTFHRLSWAALLLSLLAGVLAIGATALAWRAALTDLDHRVPATSAAQILLVGQLGKYLPGSVWSYVLQMELGRRLGVPRARAFLASLVTTGLGITVGLVVGVLGLPAVWRATHGVDLPGVARVAFFSVLVLLPIGLVCSHPAVLTRLVGLLLKLLRREPLERPLSYRGALATMGWSVVGYVFFGLHLWLLVLTTPAGGADAAMVSFGAMALAVAVSTIVVIAPSGIGVREPIIAFVLTGLGLSFGVGFALALASRLILTVADVVAAGAAAAVAVRRIRRTPA